MPNKLYSVELTMDDSLKLKKYLKDNNIKFTTKKTNKRLVEISSTLSGPQLYNANKFLGSIWLDDFKPVEED